MTVQPYDWRLAFPMMEERDGYFTKLQSKIEAMYKASGGTKVVLTSHSMGALVVHYFFAWVTSPQGGGGGRNWVDQHVHAYVNIAGAHLGVPKAVTTLLSGEMSDTVVMNPMAAAVEQFFGRQVRRELWNTWGSIWAMLPKGGNAVWGVGADMCNVSSSVTEESVQQAFEQVKAERSNKEADEVIQTEQDPHCPAPTKGGRKVKNMSPFLAITDSPETLDEIVGPAHHVPLMTRRRAIMHHYDVPHHQDHHHDDDDEHEIVSTSSTGLNQTNISPTLRNFLARQDFSLESVIDLVTDLSHGLFEGTKNLANADMFSLYSEKKNRPTAHRNHEKAWHDPSQTPLPHAPNMKIYCLYGVGKPTERAYYYKLNHAESKDGGAPSSNNASNDTHAQQQHMLNIPPFILDSDVSQANPDFHVETGVKYSDGDGSVPLLSLGYLCADAWTRPSSGLNPSRASVYTREYAHKAEFTVEDPMRSGPANTRTRPNSPWKIPCAVVPKVEIMSIFWATRP